MHVRTFYAAVSDETPSADASDAATRERHNAKATQTLWAERPLHVLFDPIPALATSTSAPQRLDVLAAGHPRSPIRIR